MSLEIIERNLAELAEYLGKAQEEGCFSATEVSLLTEQIDAVLAPLERPCPHVWPIAGFSPLRNTYEQIE